MCARWVARLVRLAAVAALALAAPMLVGTGPATSDSTKGSLSIVSVTDSGSGLAGAVAGRPFDVVVQALAPDGTTALEVKQATTVRLSLSPGTSGSLSGTVQAQIEKNATSTTISGAVYSTVANGVSLTVTQVSGVALSPGSASINAARSAVSASASPGSATNITDPGCAAPTPESPVCGFLLLPNGGNGNVLMSVGSCDSILTCRTVGGTRAELVTASVNLKDAQGAPLYTRSSPATLVLACDKVLCGNTGAGKTPVTVDLTDTGAFVDVPDCPAKGLLGATQDVCLDQVQTSRNNAGDTYSYVLFVHDIRGSYP